MEVDNSFLNLCENASWEKFYKDDGDRLLSYAEMYENFQEFEKDYHNQYGTRPLYHAIRSNKIEIVKKLLLKGADVMNTDCHSFSPLYYAVLKDNVEMVKSILSYSATIKESYMENYQEITYFQKVCQYSHWKIVELFLKHGCDANDIFTNDHWDCPRYSRPLHLAVSHRRLDTINVLLNHNANVNDVDDRGKSPLHLACIENFLEAVQLLLNKNALVNVYAEDKSTPLFHGLRCKNDRIVQLLLAHGAFIDSTEMFCCTIIHHPLHEVITSGCLQIMKDLLCHGLDVDMRCAPIDSSLLHIAVESEQIEIVHLLLGYNAKVNIKDTLGKIPLHYATSNENEVIMELLLQHDQDLKGSPENSSINTVDKKGLNPFHMACANMNIQCIKLLLDYGADINAEDFEGFTPLHIACRIGSYEIIHFLIKNKALVNVNSEGNLSPLDIAVLSSHEQIIELLLMNKADTISQNKNKEIPLKIAIRNMNLKAIELLLEYNPDVNNDQYKRAFLTVLTLDKTIGYNIIDCFLKYGFNIKLDNEYDDVMLFNIVKGGYLNFLEQLIDSGTDVNLFIDGETLLHIGTKNGHIDIVQLLISNKANVLAEDQNGKIPIFYAIKNKDKHLVRTFLNHGVELKHYPHLLHCAVIECGIIGCIEIVDILLDHGCDINYRDDQGMNVILLLIDVISMQLDFPRPLGYFVELADYLLKKGANVNCRNKSGYSALHKVIKLGGISNELIIKLLSYDADVDCKCEPQVSDDTPLHLSCDKENYDNYEVVAQLLNHGADINVKNKTGLTPLQVLHEHFQRNICNHLEHFGMMRFANLIWSCESSRTKDLLGRHIVKLQAAGLYVRAENCKLGRVFQQNLCKDYKSQCEREITELKKLKINGYASMYDVLIKDLIEVSRYTRNENVLDFNFMSFPEYGELIINKLRKASRRRSTFEKAKKTLNLISGRRLPDACSENVIAYLTFEDLRSVTDLV